MANGIFIWDGSGWNPSVDVMSAVIIPPGSVIPGSPTPTTIGLAISPTTVTYGGTTTLTATVTAGAAGTVAFQYLTGSVWTTIATKTVVSTKATATSVPNRTMTYRAVYTPSVPASYRPSSSAGIRCTVLPVGVKPTSPIVIGSSGNLTATYKGTGARRTDFSGDNSYYGYLDSRNGDMRSVVVLSGFGTINDIPKADIKSASITLTSRHTYPNAGTSVRLVPITNATLPSTYPTRPLGGFFLRVPDSGSVSSAIPLYIAQQFCLGSLYRGFAIVSAVAGTNGYGYLSGDSIRLTFNRR